MTAETMSANPSMEFSLDGGRTWTPADEAVSVSGMAGASLMLRYAHTNDALHSDSAIIAIPARLEAPAVSADLRSGKFSAPEGTEFSTDGKAWGKIPSSIGEDLLGKTVLFRLPATDKNFASATVEVTLPLRSDAPVLSLNKEALTVNTDTSMEYSIDNGSTWTKCVNNMSVANLLGKTMTVRYAAAKGAPASSETILVIPTRGAAPTVTVYNVSAYGRNDGVITGTNTSMEYRRTGVSSWTKVTGSSIGFLSAGTYEIRYAATDNSIASESRVVTIYSPAPDQSNPGTNPGNPGGSNPGGGWFYPSNPGGGSSGTSSKSYTVKFDANGGSSVKSQTVDRNGYAEAPQAPTKEGYTFLGWYTDAKLTKLYDFESKVKSSFTLYAGWAAATLSLLRSTPPRSIPHLTQTPLWWMATLASPMSMDAPPESLSRMRVSPGARLRQSSSGSCRRPPRPASTPRAMTLWMYPATPGTTRRFPPSSRPASLVATATVPSVPTSR